MGNAPSYPVPLGLYGIIGHPLGHSMSPALHNWAFSRMGHPGAFFAWPMPPEAVPHCITAFKLLGVKGACVTIPHKERVLALLDKVSPRGKHIGAVNTLYWEGNCLCGENTDVDGFAAPLQHWKGKKALVLGAGGAARAVMAALQEMKIAEVLICNREAQRAQELATHFGARAVPWEERGQQQADLVVNTTPLGMKGKHEQESPFPATSFMKGGGAHCLAYDLVYNPLQTRFLREAAEAGWSTQDGLDMFVGQARRQQELWTGQNLPAEDMRAFVLQLLSL